MIGAEYVNVETLRSLWEQLDAAFTVIDTIDLLGIPVRALGVTTPQRNPSMLYPASPYFAGEMATTFFDRAQNLRSPGGLLAHPDSLAPLRHVLPP